MKKETRTVVYDDELRIEAYRFEGIIQPFPGHFHEHYVIGFVEDGERVLSCRDREYVIEKGSIVLFNPGDSHACVQSDEGTFDYRGFNISKEIMLDLAEEVTGKRELPGFFYYGGKAADGAYGHCGMRAYEHGFGCAVYGGFFLGTGRGCGGYGNQQDAWGVHSNPVFLQGECRYAPADKDENRRKSFVKSLYEWFLGAYEQYIHVDCGYPVQSSVDEIRR